jgi:hypothetical protein
MAGHISRAAAEVARRILVDTCAITRPGPDGAINPTTLAYGDPTEVWTGACFVNERPNTSTAGAQFVSLEGIGRTDVATRVRLPLECPQLEAGDLIRVTASASAGLVDAELEVISDTVGTFAVTKIVHARWRRRAR